MDEVKLLPCPFCGGGNVKVERVSALSQLRAVYCGDCEIMGEKMTSPERAAEAWNKREATRPTLVTDELVERVDYVVKMARQYEAAVRMGDGEFVHGASQRLEQAKRELLAAMPAIPPQSLDGNLDVNPATHEPSPVPRSRP